MEKRAEATPFRVVLTFLTKDEEVTNFTALQRIDLKSAGVSSRGRQAGIAEALYV